MKNKTFDCVRMKRNGAEKVQQQTTAMTPEQELAFWREQTDQLCKKQKAVRASHRASENKA